MLISCIRTTIPPPALSPWGKKDSRVLVLVFCIASLISHFISFDRLARDLIHGAVDAATKPSSSPPEEEERQEEETTNVKAEVPSGSENESDDDSGDDVGLKMTPICYSPLTYWIKFLIGLAFTIMNIVYLARYYNECPALPNFSPGNVWYILMTISWAILGLFHGIFIIQRFRNKTPVSKRLYDGPFEHAMKFPLTLDLFFVIAIAIWGLIVSERAPCGGYYSNAFQIKSIIYLVLAILMVMTVYGCKKGGRRSRRRRG